MLVRGDTGGLLVIPGLGFDISAFNDGHETLELMEIPLPLVSPSDASASSSPLEAISFIFLLYGCSGLARSCRLLTLASEVNDRDFPW